MTNPKLSGYAVWAGAKSTKKLDSIHKVQVECIGKGKAHKKFDFRAQEGLVASVQANWSVEMEIYPKTPHNGIFLNALHKCSNSLDLSWKL